MVDSRNFIVSYADFEVRIVLFMCWCYKSHYRSSNGTSAAFHHYVGRINQFEIFCDESMKIQRI